MIYHILHTRENPYLLPPPSPSHPVISNRRNRLLLLTKNELLEKVPKNCAGPKFGQCPKEQLFFLRRSYQKLINDIEG